MDYLGILLKILLIGVANANLEGPFLFWGPKNLAEYRRSALQAIEQDDLMKIYENQAAIVVFNNQDSVPLSGENFPRLRKLLESKSLLVLPQDFLDVHPDYVNNETQVFTLQGPNSERDAEITETFNRLEDVYGAGRVLAVLGNSMSSTNEEDMRRERRAAVGEGDETTASSKEQVGDKQETNAPSKEQLGEKQQRTTTNEYALYNATMPRKDTKSVSLQGLIYASTWPVLRTETEEIVFKRYISASTDYRSASTDYKSATKKPATLKMIVNFLYDKDKISMHFRFTESLGWWQSAGVEVHIKNVSLLLQPPSGYATPAAVIGKSYHCSGPTVYQTSSATLTFEDLQMEPFIQSTEKFSDAFDCTGFTTEPILSGALVTIFLNIIFFVSLMMIFDIRTNDRYESCKAKQLVITVNE